MKSNFTKSIVALAVGLFVANTAHADLIIDDGSAPVVSKPVLTQNKTTINPLTMNPQSNSSVTLINVTQIGSASESDLIPISGFAQDLPLMTVLKQIVPNGWKATKIGNVDLNKNASWKGGQSWVKTLDTIAIAEGFSANVNWNNKVVTITPTTSSSSSSVVSSGKNPFSGGSSTNFTSNSKNIGSSQLNSAISTSPVYSSATTTWLLSKDKTLKQNIQDWAKQAGWVVSWDAPDYRIVADVTLTGAIDSNDGPIARVIAAYKNADQPLSAQLSEGNKVIRIQSRNYQQETVVNQDMNDTFPGYASRY